MRPKCISQDRPPMLRRNKTSTLDTAWYYSNPCAHSWRTEIPLARDLDSKRRSWLEGERKPVPKSKWRRPDPSPQR